MRSHSTHEKRLVRFSFRDLYLNDSLSHRERNLGSHDGDRLQIGKLIVADRDIQYLNTAGNQLHVGWQDADSGPRVASMIVDTDVRPIRDAIHFGLSRRVFDTQLQEAGSQGLGNHCRDTECQFCQAKILSLDAYPWSPQVYCPWCDSLNTTVEVPDLGLREKEYRICPLCGMYSRPRNFTIAYFWFLIFHASVSHKIVVCCNDCMRPEAWKMLFGNLFGVLGLPLAVTQLVRVYRDSVQSGPFRGLDEANRLLKQGRVDKALDRYWKIIERHPVSAGVLFNVALGLIANNDRPHARQTLQLCLENCGNYTPAAKLLDKLQPAADHAAETSWQG